MFRCVINKVVLFLSCWEIYVCSIVLAITINKIVLFSSCWEGEGGRGRGGGGGRCVYVCSGLYIPNLTLLSLQISFLCLYGSKLLKT